MKPSKTRKRVAKPRVGASRLRRFALGAVAVLALLAGALLYSDGSLSSGFATLGKVVGVSLDSLGAPAQSAVVPSPSVPAAALGAPQPAGTRKYYFGKSLVASASADGALLYYHQDGLGSNRVVSNANAEIQSKSTAYPYGEPVEQAGFSQKQARYTFTGKELDSKLYYFGARYYNPRTARFTAVDPAPAVDSAYAYAGGNPLMFVDPDGAKFHTRHKIEDLKYEDKYVSAELSYYDKKTTPLLKNGDIPENDVLGIRNMIERRELLLANDLVKKNSAGKLVRCGGICFYDGGVFKSVVVQDSPGSMRRSRAAFLAPFNGDVFDRLTADNIVNIVINGKYDDLFVAATFLHEYVHYSQPINLPKYDKELEAYGVGAWFQLLNGKSPSELTHAERTAIFGSSADFRKAAEDTGLYDFGPVDQKSGQGSDNIVDPPPAKAQDEQVA